VQTDRTSDRILLGSKVYLSHYEPFHVGLTYNLAILLRPFENRLSPEGSMARPLRSEFGSNVVTICPKERSGAGLTIEEAVEFEVLDALPPFDDSGNIAWTFEGGPITSREKRWLELYAKKGAGVGRVPARG
jgi:hypothetical protein